MSNKPLNFNQMRKLRPGGLREPEPSENKEVTQESKPPLDHPSPPKPTKPTQGGLRPPNIDIDHAPARDFNRRANSLDRDALPAGHFPGSSKKLYDALYLRTRGAHVPVKTIRATRREIGHWSGIKNIKTIAAHLSYLSTIGLIIHHWERGSTEGSIYEVFLPEEANPLGLRRSKTTSVPLRPPEPPLDQKMVLPLDQNSVLGGSSQTTENIDTSASPKTSFKTNTERSDDDEAFAGFLNLMREATKEITGKELSKTEVDRWREVGEVLVTELKIAAARTTVSSVPSFLAEHLRRRLFKKDRKEMSAPEIKGEENQPPWSISKEKLKECPDCGGTGFYYPKGFEGGVAKCKHEKLTESEHPSSSMSTEDKS